MILMVSQGWELQLRAAHSIMTRQRVALSLPLLFFFHLEHCCQLALFFNFCLSSLRLSVQMLTYTFSIEVITEIKPQASFLADISLTYLYVSIDFSVALCPSVRFPY